MCDMTQLAAKRHLDVYMQRMESVQESFKFERFPPTAKQSTSGV